MARRTISGSKVKALGRYKEILRAVLEKCPSGTRQRLAAALGTHRSFVSQIANPAYSVPIPGRHIPTIVRICHFSQEELVAFTAAHALAHPEQAGAVSRQRPVRMISLMVPDFADSKKNKHMEAALAELVRGLSTLFA